MLCAACSSESSLAPHPSTDSALSVTERFIRRDKKMLVQPLPVANADSWVEQTRNV